MGEHGGRRRRGKPMVERALTLNVDLMVQRGNLAPGSRTRGVMNWTNAVGQVTSSVSYEADLVDPANAWLRLRYSTPDPRTGGRRQADQRVTLTTTRPGFGGRRWWFVDGGRRVGRLHLPPGGDRFGSRIVHGLAYASQRAGRGERVRGRAANVKKR